MTKSQSHVGKAEKGGRSGFSPDSKLPDAGMDELLSWAEINGHPN